MLASSLYSCFFEVNEVIEVSGVNDIGSAADIARQSIVDNFERSDNFANFFNFYHHLLYHSLYTIINIHTSARGLALQAATVEGVPTIVVNSANFVNSVNFDYSRCLAVTIEVDAERRQLGCCAAVAYLEVGTAGTEAGARLRIVQLVVAAHEEDALVLSIERLRGVRAKEAHAGVAVGFVVEATVGLVDIHAVKDEVSLSQVRATLPLNNICRRSVY